MVTKHEESYMANRWNGITRSYTEVDVQRLRGSVTVAEHGKQYTLTSTFTPDGTIKHVYSAHTNKRLYLTSHLYVFFQDIPAGQSRSVVVNNMIESVDVESSITTSTWGEMKKGPAALASPRC